MHTLDTIRHRIPAPVLLATVATVALFFTMQALIRTERSALTKAPPRVAIVVSRVEMTEPTATPTYVPPEPPPDTPPATETSGPGTFTQVGFRPPSPGTRWTPSNRITDGDLVPVVMPAVDYPQQAARREIEGYVLLAFTVTDTGAVADIEIIEAVPPGIFDRAAVEAARRSKYQPRVVDGTPIAVAGVRRQITFELARR